MRSGLPDVPQRAIRAAREDLDASIGVDRNCRLAGDHAAERTPCGPWPGMRSRLPDMPQRVVCADSKDLQPSICVECGCCCAAEGDLGCRRHRSLLTGSACTEY